MKHKAFIYDKVFWYDKMINDKMPLVTTDFTMNEYIKLNKIVNLVKSLLEKDNNTLKVNELPLKLQQKDEVGNSIIVTKFMTGRYLVKNYIYRGSNNPIYSASVGMTYDDLFLYLVKDIIL